MEKEDCFANTGNHCYCLKEKYCKKKECAFYKKRNEVSLSEIEKAVKNYNIYGNKKF